MTLLKKNSSVLVALIVVFSSLALIQTSSAVVKQGGACAKLGSTSNFGGKKYTCILVKSKNVWNAGVAVPTTKTTTSAPTTTTTVVRYPLAMTSTDPAAQCQIKDLRVQRFQNNNVGFPLSKDELVTQGNLNVILMPVDFSDAPGAQSPMLTFQPQIDQMTAWAKQFSNGKLSFKFQTSSSWVRAPLPSTSYSIPKPVANGPNTYFEYQNNVAQSLIDASGKLFTYSNGTAIFYYFSKPPAGVSDGLTGRNVVLQTPDGPISTFFFAPGTYAYSHPSTMWQLYIHEMLHSQGLAGHAPGNGFVTGVMQNQDGAATLDAWSTFLLDWFNQDQIFCVSKSHVSSQYVELAPLDNSKTGFKTLLIPLSLHEILVVESRRAEGYASSWKKDAGGLLVYVVDTYRDNDRSHESSDDTGNDPTYSKYAFYLHAVSAPATADNSFDKYLNYFIKTGSTVTFQGVRISLVASGTSDVVHIESV